MEVVLGRLRQAAQAVSAKEVFGFWSASKGQMRPDSDVGLSVSGLP
jgi:predicted nucleotidyltransferase